MLNNIRKATQLMSSGAKIPTLCDFKVHILSITLHCKKSQELSLSTMGYDSEQRKP